MGIAYRCDASTGLSVAVWDGEITSEQRDAHIAALAAEPEWGASGRLLTDLTGVCTSALPSPDQILDAASAFMQHLAGQVREARWAMVAGDTFAQAQRFSSYIEEEVPRLIVFNALDTASTWLGVDAIAVAAVIDELRGELRSADCRNGA